MDAQKGWEVGNLFLGIFYVKDVSQYESFSHLE